MVLDIDFADLWDYVKHQGEHVDQTWVLVQRDAEVSSSSGSDFLPLVFV